PCDTPLPGALSQVRARREQRRAPGDAAEEQIRRDVGLPWGRLDDGAPVIRGELGARHHRLFAASLLASAPPARSVRGGGPPAVGRHRVPPLRPEPPRNAAAAPTSSVPAAQA